MERLKKQKILLSFVIVVLVAAFTTLGVLIASEDPSSVVVTLYETQLLTDGAGSPITVFSSPSPGVTVDIVGSPGSLFGQGDVAEGTYNRVKFRLGNEVIYSGPDPCPPGGTFVNDAFLINAAALSTDQVDVYFATVGDSGGTGWFNNGTAQFPLLLQNPIQVQDGQTTVVKISFDTSDSLKCVGGTTAILEEPTIGVVNYVQSSPSVLTTTTSYWFAHYNINTNLHDGTTGAIMDTTAIANMTLDEKFRRTMVSNGWGTVTFNAPNTSTGIGTWSVDIITSYDSGGMSEHRHGFAIWDSTNPGYNNPADPAAGGPMVGDYVLSGTHVIMTSTDFTADGHFSVDGNTLVLVNFAGTEDSDIIYGVKKATSYPSSLPAGHKYLVINPGMAFSYAPSTYGKNMFMYSGMKAIDVDSDIIFEWRGMAPFQYTWNTSSQLSTIISSGPEESGFSTTGISAMLAFNSSGFATTSPDNNTIFIGMGQSTGNSGNGLFAGTASEYDNTTNKNHNISTGFVLDLADSISLSDLDGQWVLIGVAQSAFDGGDGTWDDGNERPYFGVTYGNLEITSGGNMTRSFTTKNTATGAAILDTGTNVMVAGTEYYLENHDAYVPTTNTNAVSVPLFYVKESAIAATIDARVVLDRSKNVFVFWTPIGNDNIPNPSGTDIGDFQQVGIGVRVQ